ncbi:helix-turn-helix domain-containing protein [Mycobacterium sp. pW045]|uniref:helix-turn-helix domain-containing protein n=1 Tax=Mycobacterium sp. pW045 TaxID=3238984 RepID=UPI00351B10E4
MNAADNWADRIASHIGPDGAVMVPPRIAHWLETQAGLTADRRINLRAADPAAYEVLAALHLSALSHRSGSGTKPAAAQPKPQESNPWMTTTQAAEQLGVTDRAIRKWCRNGRIPAKRHGCRWLIHSRHLNTVQIT